MIYETVINQHCKMLKNLSDCMGKAAAFADHKKIEMDVLLNYRLAPDQFNFTRQVQIASDTAKFCAARLTGKEAPSFEDNEKTLGDLKTRLEKTISYLKTFKAEDFNGCETRKISQPRWEGKYLHGAEYLAQHAIPNLYFHVTTAYSILRHAGVEIGKKDYLGEMPYKH